MLALVSAWPLALQVEQKKNVHKCPQARSVYDGEREGNREGLFNWWWVGEKQRQEKMRGSIEWRKKSMRSSERNDDGGNSLKKQKIL